jgi:hypothetical protein
VLKSAVYSWEGLIGTILTGISGIEPGAIEFRPTLKTNKSQYKIK